MSINNTLRISATLCYHAYLSAAVAVAISTAINWSSIYTFTQTFPSILAAMQTFGTLYLISFLNLSAGLFFLFLLPETKVHTCVYIDVQLL